MASNTQQRIYASLGDSSQFIDVSDVVVLVAASKYTRIFSHQRAEFLDVRLGLTEAYEALDENVFVRISRSCVVNRCFIETIDCDEQGRIVVRLRGISEPLKATRTPSTLKPL